MGLVIRQTQVARSFSLSLYTLNLLEKSASEDVRGILRRLNRHRHGSRKLLWLKHLRA